MIHLITPWSNEKNLGKAYNDAFKKVGANDWICFTDLDAVHTTHFAPLYMEHVIKDNPSYSLFTAVTNRVFNKEQVPFPEYWQVDGMNFHRLTGEQLWKDKGVLVTDAKSLISGVVILTSKKAWKACGGFKDGMLGVDNEYDKSIRAAGLKTGIMQGIYVQHFYRNGDTWNKAHLK